MKILEKHISKNLPCYTNIKFNPKYITIHETEIGILDNEEYKNVDYYYSLLANPQRGREKVGYHFLVDDTNAYEFIPSNIVTFHTGTVEGNYNSIGIERCVYTGINHMNAIILQARLTAFLMKKYNIPIENVRTHKSWSGKECPARLLNNIFISFEDFIKLTDSEYKKIK